MRVALAGFGGYIGRHLSRALKRRADDVVELSSSTHGLFDAGSGCLVGALPRVESLDALIYLSQSPYFRETPARADHLWGVNVVAALTAAEWARKAGATRILYTSSGNVYQPTFAPCREADPVRRDDWYALSKVQAEEVLRLMPGMQTISLRLFGVYGPGQQGRLIPNLIRSIRAGEVVRLQPHPFDAADRDGLRIGLTYIDDVVRAFLQALVVDVPSVVNVASPEVLSVRSIAEEIGLRVGRPPVFEVMKAPRTFDLVPDATLCTTVMPGPRTPFAEGISVTVNDWLSTHPA